jgi:hypothetical protein
MLKPPKSKREKNANVILARQSEFDALLAQKYPHAYDQSAIAD